MSEVDEICIRKSPSQWLWAEQCACGALSWISVSRFVGQVTGFVLGDRSKGTLKRMWEDVPEAYRTVPVCTEHLAAYQQFFPAAQHEHCDKRSGKSRHFAAKFDTSIVEAMNTKWRQRQSGLVRRSCGVWKGIETDITDRFMILLERHNQERIAKWKRKLAKQQSL